MTQRGMHMRSKNQYLRYIGIRVAIRLSLALYIYNVGRLKRELPGKEKQRHMNPNNNEEHSSGKNYVCFVKRKHTNVTKL